MAISKLSKMAACRQLGFDVTGNIAIRSADHENPTLEPNMKCIGSPVVEIWSFEYVGGIWNPDFGGREGEVVTRRGSAMATFERAMMVSYRPSLSIVTFALSVVPNHSAAICDRFSDTRINRGWVTLGPNFRVFPWSRPLFGSAESGHPRLTNGEIISKEFQPMWSQSTNVTDRQTDRQTDIIRLYRKNRNYSTLLRVSFSTICC